MTTLPTIEEASLARVSSHQLSRYRDGSRPVSLRVLDAGEERTIDLPASAVSLLTDILEAIGTGRGVSVIPKDAELTTVQAAGILRVSRPFLIKLLSAGELPHRKVGKHRRILMEDVMTYKARMDRAREAVLDQLAADAQENGMGYPGR